MSDYTIISRRRTFVLDTKSTCFLCLKEILNDNLDPLQDPLSEEPPPPPPPQPRFSLRSILLYLKLNPKSIFATVLNCNDSLKSLKSAKLLKEITNFSVTLCPECLDLAETLSDVCQQLELVQMRVDHCLENFYEVLAYSDSNPEGLKEFREKMTGGLLESVQKMIAEQLRKDTKSKCCYKLNHAKPRIHLLRKPDSPQNQPKTPIITSVTSCPPPVFQTSSMPVIISTKTLSTVPPPTALFGGPPPPPPPPPPKPISLFPNICGDPNCGPFAEKYQLVHHFRQKLCHFSRTGKPPQITFSPGPASKSPQAKKYRHLFPASCKCCGSKLYNWSEWRMHTKQRCIDGAVNVKPMPTPIPPQPKILPNLLPVSIITPNQPPPSSTSTSKSTEKFPKTCDPGCGGQFFTRDEYVNHLTISCLLNPKTDSNKITSSSSSSPAPPPSKPTPSVVTSSPILIQIPVASTNSTTSGSSAILFRPLLPKGPLPCPHCTNAVFSDESQLFQHKAHLHAEQLFLSSKVPHLSIERFKAYCEQLLQTFVMFSRIPSKTNSPSSMEGNFTSNNFRCVFCPNKSIIHGWTHFYIHVVKDHQDEIRKKLQILQKTRCGKEGEGLQQQLLRQSLETPTPPTPTVINLEEKSPPTPPKPVEQQLSTWRKQRRSVLELAQFLKKRRESGGSGGVPKDPLAIDEDVGGGGDQLKIKIAKLSCEICGQVYTELAHLVEHRMKMHNMKKPEYFGDLVAESPGNISNDSVGFQEEDDSLFEETEVFVGGNPIPRVKREPVEKEEEKIEECLLTVTEEKEMEVLNGVGGDGEEEKPEEGEKSVEIENKEVPEEKNEDNEIPEKENRLIEDDKKADEIPVPSVEPEEPPKNGLAKSNEEETKPKEDSVPEKSVEPEEPPKKCTSLFAKTLLEVSLEQQQETRPSSEKKSRSLFADVANSVSLTSDIPLSSSQSDEQFLKEMLARKDEEEEEDDDEDENSEEEGNQNDDDEAIWVTSDLWQ